MTNDTDKSFRRYITPINIEEGFPLNGIPPRLGENTTLSGKSLPEIKSQITKEMGTILQKKETVILHEQTKKQIEINNNSQKKLEEEIQKLEEEIQKLEEEIQQLNDKEELLKKEKKLENLKKIREKKYDKLVEIEKAQKDMTNQDKYLTSKSSEIRDTLLTLPTEIAPKIKIKILGKDYELKKGKKVTEENPQTTIEDAITNKIDEYLENIIDIQPENNKINLIDNFKQALIKQILETLLNPFTTGENKYDEETMKYYTESIIECINDNIIMVEETIEKLKEIQDTINKLLDNVTEENDTETINLITDEYLKNTSKTNIYELSNLSIINYLESLLKDNDKIKVIANTHKESKETTIQIIEGYLQYLKENIKTHQEKLPKISKLDQLDSETFTSIFSEISIFLGNGQLTKEKINSLKNLRMAAHTNILGSEDIIDPNRLNQINEDLIIYENMRKIADRLKNSSRQIKRKSYAKRIEEQRIMCKKIAECEAKKTQIESRIRPMNTKSKLKHTKEKFEEILGIKIPEQIINDAYKKSKDHSDLILLKNMIKIYTNHIKKFQDSTMKQNDEQTQYHTLKMIINKLRSTIQLTKQPINREDITTLEDNSEEIIKLIAIKKIFECSAFSLEKKLLYSDMIKYNLKIKKFTIKCEDINDIEILHNIFGKENIEITNSIASTETIDKKEENPTKKLIQILSDYYIINNKKELEKQINEFCKNGINRNTLKNLLENEESFKKPDTKIQGHEARTIGLGDSGRRLIFIKSGEKNKNYTLIGLYNNDNTGKKLSKI